jgi:hypothetical protein
LSTPRGAGDLALRTMVPWLPLTFDRHVGNGAASAVPPNRRPDVARAHTRRAAAADVKTIKRPRVLQVCDRNLVRRATVIGKLQFTGYDAILLDSQEWSCSADPRLELVLNSAFGPPLDERPSEGFPGVTQVTRAAKHFKVPYQLAHVPFDVGMLY